MVCLSGQVVRPAPAWCRHCRTGKVQRPRGLCWICYYAPGVRDLYPSTSKYASRGVGNLTGTRPPAPWPCPNPPGSAGRLRTLAARAEAGVDLWHPRDARFERAGGLTC